MYFSQNNIPACSYFNTQYQNSMFLIYYKISFFQLKRPLNNYRDECLLVTFVIQRCSYKKIFWKHARIVQEDTHAPTNCIFIEIKPQVFYDLMHVFWCLFLLRNTFFKEHLWGAASEKCCNHNQLERHFSTLEDIIEGPEQNIIQLFQDFDCFTMKYVFY